MILPHFLEGEAEAQRNDVTCPRKRKHQDSNPSQGLSAFALCQAHWAHPDELLLILQDPA